MTLNKDNNRFKWLKSLILKLQKDFKLKLKPRNGRDDAPDENGEAQDRVEGVQPEEEEGDGDGPGGVAGGEREFVNAVGHEHVTLVDLKKKVSQGVGIF